MKPTRRLLITLAAGAMLAAPIYAADGGKPAGAAKEAEIKQQTHCPVMGGKINPNSYADVEGKRIYVCCPGCIPTIKKDPAKYIKKREDQGVTIADAPKQARDLD